MRVLAYIVGITIAALFVAAFAAAEHQSASTPAAPVGPASPELTTPEPEAGSLHLAAAVAALSALFIVAPMAGRF